jgi:hypothetical protein
VIAVAQIEVVGIRLCHVIGRLAPESVEALSVRHIQPAHNERIHDAEHHGVRADRQSQRQNGGGEAGRLVQLA